MSRMSVFGSALYLGFDELDQVISRQPKGGNEGYPPYNVEHKRSSESGDDYASVSRSPWRGSPPTSLRSRCRATSSPWPARNPMEPKRRFFIVASPRDSSGVTSYSPQELRCGGPSCRTDCWRSSWCGPARMLRHTESRSRRRVRPGEFLPHSRAAFRPAHEDENRLYSNMPRIGQSAPGVRAQGSMRSGYKGG